MALAETKAADGTQLSLRVWLRNTPAKHVSLPVATLLGQGGQGSFVSLVSTKLEEDEQQLAWRYTRITRYTKESHAERANWYLIFNQGGTPLEGKPKLPLLSHIASGLGNNLTLYGHSRTRGWAPFPSRQARRPWCGCLQRQLLASVALVLLISARA